MIYWNSSEAGTITVPQQSIVIWEWDSTNAFDVLQPGFRGYVNRQFSILCLNGILLFFKNRVFEGQPGKAAGDRLFSASISPKGKLSHRFTDRGTYIYHDGVHGEAMTGTITVVGLYFNQVQFLNIFYLRLVCKFRCERVY